MCIRDSVDPAIGSPPQRRTSMKEDKSTPETASSRQTLKETPVRLRASRPAPRTSIDQGRNTQSAETQQMLNAILADEFVLYVRTLNCHWNVRGMQFHSLHAFFEDCLLYTSDAADERSSVDLG